ncbi:MAG: hypothetical protein V4717_00010 [Bacteroidota bacterium]
MHKYYLLSLVITLYFIKPAQGQNNIGIGTITPHSSAVLDLTSTTKGLLVPRMNSEQRNDIIAPSTGLLVYDLTAKAFFSYNGSGWVNISGNGNLTLPYTATAANINPLLNLTNSSSGITIKATAAGNHAIIGSTNAPGFAGIRGEGNATTSAGVRGSSNNALGVGVEAINSQGGLALAVNGDLRISGGSTAPGLGKILTSDAAGNAAWKENEIGFEVNGLAGNGLNVLALGESNKLHFNTEVFDAKGNYNLYNQTPSSSFIVPVNGFYHFDASFLFTGGPDYEIMSLILKKKSGGTTTVIESMGDVRAVVDNDYVTLNINTTTRLLAGDQVWVEAYYYLENSGNVEFETQAGSAHFSGFLVFAR